MSPGIADCLESCGKRPGWRAEEQAPAARCALSSSLRSADECDRRSRQFVSRVRLAAARALRPMPCVEAKRCSATEPGAAGISVVDNA